MAVSFKTIRKAGLLTMILIVLSMGSASFINTEKITNNLSEVQLKQRLIFEKADSVERNFLKAQDVFFAFTQGEDVDSNNALIFADQAIKKSQDLERLIEEEDKKSVHAFITDIKRFKLAVSTYADEFRYDPTGSTAIEMNALAKKISRDAGSVLSKMVNDIKAKMKVSDISMFIVAKRGQRFIVITMIAGVVCGLIIAILMGKALMSPINKLIEATQHLAQGDLGYRLRIKQKDEIGVLSQAFNKMAEDLMSSRSELLSTTHYLNNIVKSMMDMLLIVDADARIIKVNNILCATLGYDEQWLLGRQAQEIVPEEENIFTGGRFKKLIQNGYTVNYEMNFKNKQGTILPAIFSGSIMRDNAGQIIGFVGIAHDISQRKKTEEAIYKAKEELERRVDERTAELSRMNEELSKEVDERKKAEKYLQVKTEDLGRTQFASLNIMEDFAMRSKELNVVLKDMQEAKRQAESASFTKSQFLARMSHEIRTPLNAIIGFSEQLENTTLDYVQKDYVQTVRDSGQLLLALINDILDISKIEARELRFEAIDFDLEYLIRSVVKMESTKIKAKNIELFYDFDETIPQSYNGDPTRIRQVIMNLVNNAIKFTENGEVWISVKSEQGPSAVKDGMRVIRIAVKDTGIGIAKEKQEKIFDAFEQADTSTTRKYGGTGLGLAICKAIVEMMQGKIWVESDPDKGSKFIFTIQLKEAASVVEKEILPIKIGQLKDKKVVIVDDNEYARRIMDMYLKELHMNVVYVASLAGEVLDWLDKARPSELPDVILSDIMMPQMSGHDLAKRIRAQDKFNTIKLIAITSDVRVGAAKETQASGFDAYLPKPIIKGDFIKIIQTVLGDMRPVPSQIITRHMAEEFSFKGLKVLVAEDNLVNQKLMMVLLNNLGCGVDIASNGQVAVDKIGKNQYDLVLMDLQMPVMGGIEATKKIREETAQKDLPIIALTAAAMIEDREQSLACGMNDYIAKPIEISKLKEKMSKWIKHGEA